MTSENSSLTITYPNGGEAFVAGNTLSIEWQSDLRIDKVNLYLSTNNGSSWSPLITEMANSGHYDLVLPQNNYENCLVKVVDSDYADVYDQSNASFSIFVCTLKADLTGDCVVDLADFAVLASEWLVDGRP